MTRAFIVVALPLSVLVAGCGGLEERPAGEFDRSPESTLTDPIEDDSGATDEPPLAGNDTAATHPTVSPLR